MWVCLCAAVNERTIQEALDSGCKSVEDLKKDHYSRTLKF